MPAAKTSAKIDRNTLLHVEARDRKTWRAWLAKNHAKVKTGIWLVYYKKGSGVVSVGYDDAVEEALCHGWIDSVINSIDARCYRRLFTLRKPKSVWSKVNKTRVERLIAAGLMMPAGLATIEIAKANGAWNAIDAVEALEMPTDFARALAKNKAAKKHFDAFSPSVRKVALYRINAAKTAATRARRIAALVEQAAADIRPDHFARQRVAMNKAQR